MSRTTRTTNGIRIVRRTPLTLLMAFTGVSLVGSPLPAQVVSTAEGGRWDDSLTWEGRRLPGPGDDVVIRGPVTHPSSCRSLTVEAGASLVAPSGRGITIGGDVVNRGTVAAGPGARFMVTVAGDLTSDGTWEPAHTRFTDGRHVLSFADGTALGGDIGATGRDVVLELAGPLRLTGHVASSNIRIVFAGSGAGGAAAGMARDPARPRPEIARPGPERPSGVPTVERDPELRAENDAAGAEAPGRNYIIIMDSRVQTPSPDHLIVLDGGRLDGIPIEGAVTIRGTPDGSGELSGHVKGDLVLEGNLRLGHTEVDGDLLVAGTITNRAGPTNVTVAGSILNRGDLRTHPESEDLAIRLGGDLVSEGSWSPGETYFEEGVHALRLATGGSLGGSVRGSSRGVTLRAASPLAFDGPVRITDLDMAGHPLSIRGPLSAGVRGATTIAGAGAAELTRVTVEDDARLEGAMKVRRLTVSGDLETDAELVNAASYSSLAVQGSLTNDGRIGLDPEGGPFDINIAAALDNRGWIDERLLPRVPLEDPTGGRRAPTPTAPEGAGPTGAGKVASLPGAGEEAEDDSTLIDHERLKDQVEEMGTKTAESALPVLTARYCISLGGFKTRLATQDHALQVDGKGDEVYLSFALIKVREDGSASGPSYITTPVMGDRNGFPDRIQAGTAGSEGGLITGNQFPENPDSPRSCTALSGNVPPLALFNDELRQDEALLVIPSVWEWDGDNYLFDRWKEWVEQQYSVIVLHAAEMVQRADSYGQSYLELDEVGVTPMRIKLPGGVLGASADRPVGVILRANDEVDYLPDSFVVNWKSNIERSPRLLSADDDIFRMNSVAGYYELYWNVERLEWVE